MKRDASCPACGLAFKRGQSAHLLAGGQLTPTKVCPSCAETGVLVVTPREGRELHVTLAPFAKHLRRLAKIYDMNGDERHVGLEQAAGILEVGKVPELDGAIAHRDSKADHVVHEQRRHERTPHPKSNGAAHAIAGSLPKCDRAILSVLAQRDRFHTRAQIAILSGYSVDSGGFAAALARLRASGYIEGPAGSIGITSAGMTAVGPVTPLPNGGELVDFWCDRVGTCGAAILQTAISAYPDKLSRDELAERTGYSAQSGGFASALARLRTLELLDGNRASDALMQAVKGHAS